VPSLRWRSLGNSPADGKRRQVLGNNKSEGRKRQAANKRHLPPFRIERYPAGAAGPPRPVPSEQAERSECRHRTGDSVNQATPSEEGCLAGNVRWNHVDRRQTSWDRPGVTKRAKRLTARGLGLSGGALLLALTADTASAQVPAVLVMKTSKVAALVAAGQTAALSMPAVLLVKEVIKAMLLKKLRLAVAAVMVLVAL
jgi:hypothetical protein